MPALVPSSSARRRWILRLLRVCIVCISLLLLANIALEIAIRCSPHSADVDRLPPASSLLLDRNGHPLAAFAASDERWHLPLRDEEISPHLLDAIVAVEDSRFTQHHGVDWSAALAAAKENLFARRIVRGGSTLTMQLARLRDPQPRGWTAKIGYAIRACQIDRELTKREIVVEYLNRAPFGGSLQGAGAASWRYFGKPCANLSLGEAALLAGLPQAPNRLRPDLHPEAAAARRRHVLARMAAVGQISPQQQAEADAEPLGAAWRPLPQDRKTGPVADGLLPALLQEKSVHAGGTISTRFDRDLQRNACVLAMQQLRDLQASGVSAAAVAVIDQRTGECLASVSLEARGEEIVTSGMDLTRRSRSTGSVLKPFIYAAAFDAGTASPQTILRDEPAAWPGYVPSNYDREFAGEITAAEALARSRNIPALMLLEQVGVERAIGVMDAAGLSSVGRSRKSPGLSLAIGGAEASPLEVAQAYAALARGAVDRKESILRPAACAAALRAIASRERTAAVCREAADLHVAWKTGTSSGHRDAWCAAVTPGGLSVAVWVGNADGKGAAVLVGQDTAAPLALKLLATINPLQADWLDLDAELAPATLAAGRSPASGKLAILSPATNAVIQSDSDLSADQQRICLQAAWRSNLRSMPGGAADARVWWFVDGTLLKDAAISEKVWWRASSGLHEIRVSDEKGRSATARVTVR